MLARSPEAARPAELLRSAGTTVTAEDGAALTMTGPTPAEVDRRAFAAGIELHELRSRTSGLEEIYFELTAGREQFAAPAFVPDTLEGAAR